MSTPYERAMATLARAHGRDRMPGPVEPSVSFLAVLGVLRERGHDGAFVGEMSRLAQVERSVSSRVLNRMVGMGIASDEVIDDDPADERHRHQFWITNEGYAVAAQLLDQDGHPRGDT